VERNASYGPDQVKLILAGLHNFQGIQYRTWVPAGYVVKMGAATQFAYKPTSNPFNTHFTYPRAGVGNLLVVLCRSNVAESLNVPTEIHHMFIYNNY
jgi:hypothetical protein